MSITAITIENFKAIKEPVRIELEPITLLFGPNSAGKSTIVQALHYAREIFERQNVDPGKTLSGGKAIDLGGFKSLVYGHDLNRPIKLRFDLDLTHEDLPEYLPRMENGKFPGYIDELVDVIAKASNRVKSAWVEISVAWSSVIEKPLVNSYEVGINGEILGRIIASEDVRQVTLVYLNWSNPGLHNEDEEFNIVGAEGEDPYCVNYGVQGLESALPAWGESLKLDGIEYGDDSNSANYIMSYGLCSIHSMMVGPGELLRDELRNFCYVGPLREIPSRNYALELSPDASRWASGLAAYDILFSSEDPFIDKVNEWLTQDEHLATGYSVKAKKYRELETDSPLSLAIMNDRLLDEDIDFKGVLMMLTEKRRLLIRDEARDIELMPQDIGVGISQVLPVVVAALHHKTGFVMIEQPELHIHPAIQVALGDLFIEQIRNATDLTFILETHSEHLMLRLLRRIRETGEKTVPESKSLSPDELSIYFIEQGDEGISCHSIRVDQEGDFIDRWPKGFFTERAEELF